jgi:hypothetical protein
VERVLRLHGIDGSIVPRFLALINTCLLCKVSYGGRAMFFLQVFFFGGGGEGHV